MFEKEAKKWVKENTHTEPSAIFGEITVYPSAEKGFQKGAEFGYNKANEWHYMKDGDLPKVGVQVLSEKGTLVIYKGEGFNWVEYSPNADNIKLRKWEEPIAWKEIVLPKEDF